MLCCVLVLTLLKSLNLYMSHIMKIHERYQALIDIVDGYEAFQRHDCGNQEPENL